MKLVSLAAALVAAAPAFAQFEGVLQMKVTAASASGTMTARVSKLGTRTEMEMSSPEMQKRGLGSSMKMVSIVKNAEPNLVTMVNDQSKTYSVVDTAKMREQAHASKRPEETWKVQKTGKDTVAGYSCEKALVTGSEGTTFEVCMTTGLAGGEGLVRALQRGRVDHAGFLKALTDAGVDGTPIRWVTRSGSGRGDMTVELVSATKEPVPASTFEVPAGYTLSSTAIPFSNPEMDKKMKEALEKMTPEQRQQFEEMMKKRSGGQQ